VNPVTNSALPIYAKDILRRLQQSTNGTANLRAIDFELSHDQFAQVLNMMIMPPFEYIMSPTHKPDHFGTLFFAAFDNIINGDDTKAIELTLTDKGNVYLTIHNNLTGV
jgi:hypothetical protein